MLLLNNADVASLLQVEDVVRVLEEAYLDLAPRPGGVPAADRPAVPHGRPRHRLSVGHDGGRLGPDRILRDPDEV